MKLKLKKTKKQMNKLFKRFKNNFIKKKKRIQQIQKKMDYQIRQNHVKF